MALKTQGSNLYIIDPDATGGPAVLEVGCVTSLTGISVARDQIDVTCLDSEARIFEPGMATPGTATFNINFDPEDETHIRLYDLWRSGAKFEMALGYSDGSAAPDLDTAGLFDLPTTRSWLVFHQVYLSNVPQDLALNSVVTSAVEVQLSGFPDFFKKA